MLAWKTRVIMNPTIGNYAWSLKNYRYKPLSVIVVDDFRSTPSFFDRHRNITIIARNHRFRNWEFRQSRWRTIQLQFLLSSGLPLRIYDCEGRISHRYEYDKSPRIGFPFFVGNELELKNVARSQTRYSNTKTWNALRAEGVRTPGGFRHLLAGRRKRDRSIIFDTERAIRLIGISPGLDLISRARVLTFKIRKWV